MDEFGDALYRMALFKVRQPAMAEDLVQETFLAAIRSKSTFRGQASEKTWLMGILKHKIHDYFREQAKESWRHELKSMHHLTQNYFHQSGLSRGAWLHHMSPQPWKSPEEAFSNREFWVTLKCCCEKLPPHVARAFLMREMDGLSTQDICEILNVSKANLWVILHRARMALRRCLELNWFEKKSASEG